MTLLIEMEYFLAGDEASDLFLHDPLEDGREVVNLLSIDEQPVSKD